MNVLNKKSFNFCLKFIEKYKLQRQVKQQKAPNLFVQVASANRSSLSTCLYICQRSLEPLRLRYIHPIQHPLTELHRSLPSIIPPTCPTEDDCTRRNPSDSRDFLSSGDLNLTGWTRQEGFYTNWPTAGHCVPLKYK